MKNKWFFVTLEPYFMQVPFELKPIIKEWEFVVILFYKYVEIADPELFLDEHRKLCESLNIKGRFIVAREGLNGICEGTPEAINTYVQELTKDPRFNNIHIKYSKGTGTSFPKLKIRARSEIVSLGLGEDDVDPNKLTGTHLKPEELHLWFENKEEFVIIDMRNDYEHEVGHFPNSVLPPLKNFRDLPKIISEIDHLKDQKVLTVCTGGVRCEKASGYLMKKGFKDVYQLDGGMVSYMEQYPAQNFLGSMYTFDGRNVIDYDGGNHPVIGKCKKCGAPTEQYIDCKNESCHGQYLICADCLAKNGKMYCEDRCYAHLPWYKRIFKKKKDC